MFGVALNNFLNMAEIYSEEELLENVGSSWGQWKFSISNEEINSKIASLPKLQVDDKDNEYWPKLFSLLQNPENSPACDLPDEFPHVQNSVDLPMDVECTPSLEKNEIEPLKSDGSDDISIEELSISLVDLCNMVAPKLRLGLNNVQEEMKSITQDLCQINESKLTLIMVNAWSHLSSEASKLCYCIPFTSNSQMCKKLCEIIIKPWLIKGPPSKIEQLSNILLPEAETVCLNLVAPLLQNGDSPLIQDILTFEELMSSMVEKHWSTLLRELLSDMRELQKWQIPSLALIVEHAKPSSEEIYLLIQLMSSSGTVYAQSRDFGALLVAVAKSLGDNDVGLGLQLKLITNSYKGPLKFKALKILEEVDA